MREQREGRHTSKKRMLESAKTALIALLIASAVFLGAETGLFSEVYRSVGMLRAIGSLIPREEGVADAAEGVSEYREAAAPLTIAVTQEDGLRYGVKYTSEVLVVYERFKLLLAEALGSAKGPEKISRTAWREALGRGGVYFDYMYEQSLSLLAEWLGGEKPEGGVSQYGARRLLLAREGDGVGLYFTRESDTEYYRAATALQYFSLEALLLEYPAGGAAFEYENPGGRGLGPYFLFMNELPAVPSAESRATGIDVLDELLPVFGMNRYVAESITQSGGEEYIENDLSLLVGADGLIRFRGGNPPEAESLSQAEAIDMALSVAEACLRPLEGRDFLQLRSLGYRPETMEYTVTFTYILAGLPVIYPGSSSAAEIKIRGGSIVGAALYAREYTTSPDMMERLLPEEAGFASLMSEGEPWLVYRDSGDSVAAAWDLIDG